MGYHEADVLSRSNKEFITSLFPSENIYQTLLPMEARDAIGKVGKDTEPVRKMLESIGFKYTQEVDPFDGGPHYRCETKDIKPMKSKVVGELTQEGFVASDAKEMIVAIPQVGFDFFAAKLNVSITPQGRIALDKKEVGPISVPWGQVTTAIPF